MCRYGEIVEKVFSKSITQLQRSNKRPPNKQSLRLYREVIKFCSDFNWPNDDGRLWKDILRENARKEFVQSKEEKDPLILHQMVVTTKDAIQKTKLMVNYV